MKIKKSILLPLLIAVGLFIIPFFWLKPGEMDLGGDSSRLYFYDPASYLHVQTLYNVISSGVGGYAISYYSFPFMLFLIGLQWIFHSPTILIDISNGMKFCIAFISCYFIVKELLKGREFITSKSISDYAAIFAGLFYIFSPILITGGWDRAILTHTQVFLNPLMFFFLLRYFVGKEKIYLVGALIVSFIFSFNFSFVGTPGFFAFYPLSFLFLLLYTKFIKQSQIPFKGLIVGGLIFLILQAFHLMPHILNLFSAGSDINFALFSDQTKLVRGLDYFTAIAPSIKVSISLLNLAQVREIVLVSFFYIIFPIIILLGFLWNKGKTVLLTGIIFLVSLFFASANITDIGFTIYKLLFYVPGFQIFRNFYGQWAFTYTFFYTILVGQSLAIVLTHIEKVRYRYFLLAFLLLIFFVTGWPLLNGSMVNSVHFQSNNIKQVIQMDPSYERVLGFVHFLPDDGKILTLPLPGPGYQLIAGKDGGAYIGPSTFSYLAGKSDFTGYDGLNPYGDFFLRAVRDKNYSVLQKLFSLLNIHYVFYNSDPYIYDENFPIYPYNYVKDYLPVDQTGYKEFIKELPLEESKKVDFGDKYHFYPVSDNLVFPHIYNAVSKTYVTDPISFPFIAGFDNRDRPAAFYFKESQDENDPLVLEGQTSNPLFLLQNNYHLHRHEPFVSLRLDEFFYPFSILREKFELWRHKKNHDQYIDFSFLYLSKRILEVARWSDKLPLLKHDILWEEPKIWEFYKEGRYNSWEASILRYKKGMFDLMNWIDSADESPNWKRASKIKVNEQLFQHQVRLKGIIKNILKETDEKEYLYYLSNNTFKDLFDKLNLELYDPSLLQYDLIMPQSKSGEYEIYLEKKDYLVEELPLISLHIEDHIVKPLKKDLNSDLIRLENVRIQNTEKKEAVIVVMHLPPINLLKSLSWENSGNATLATEGTILKINNLLENNSGGLVQEIPGWQPNKQYLVSFDYQTLEDDFIFRVYDKRFKDNLKKETNSNAYLEKNLSSKTWITHQSVITSDNKSVAGFIQILGNSNKIRSEIHIKNLSVVEIRYPKIFFKKINQNIKVSTLPKIFFTKINPTKYKIQVNGVSGPYTLVFQEQFNKNWKLENTEKNSKGLRSIIARSFAAVSKRVTNIFIKDYPLDNKVIRSYFGGYVEEGVHQERFIDKNTFETWGKDSVANHRHFKVNGYANAWNINPEDMDGKESYTFILEMTTQKQFYPPLFISIVAFFSLIIYFLTRIIKKK